MPSRPYKQTSLAKRGVLLLLLPAVLQIVLVILLIYVHRETGFYHQRAVQDREILDSLGDYLLTGFATLHSVDKSISNQTFDPNCDKHLQSLKEDSAQLEQLWDDFPRRRSEIVLFQTEQQWDAVRKDFANRPRWIHGITDALAGAVSATKQANLQIDRQQGFNQARASWEIAYAQLNALAQYDESSAANPQSQAKLRNMCMMFLIACSITNLALLLLIGLLFTRDILSRLNIMLDNTVRLAKEQELQPSVSGADEIARLDSAFHEMSASLKETMHTHKAMLENAQDLICSMDAQGRFLAVNQAAATMLGHRPEKLINTCLMDLINADQESSTAQKLIDVVTAGQQAPFETRMVCKNKSLIDVLWSASWSPVDETIFCVAHDITDKKAAEQFKKDVVQMVSHDLRSPLTAISNFHELLEAGLLGDLEKEGIEQVEVAKRSTERMLALINDLLDVDRMQSGMLELARSDVRLADAFAQAVESVLPLANTEEIRIITFPDDLVVYADQHRLVQILVNLLSNAIKFSPKGSTIALSAHQLPGFVTVLVKDEGRGIPQHLIDSIFKPFSQVQSSDATVKKGSGLGLAICKALVELHAGKISVESELGKGSAFSVRLPTHASDARSQTPSQTLTHTVVEGSRS